MIDRVSKNSCTGCGACTAVCPKAAIVMREDEDGFLFPQTDRESCVECGRCEAACPALSGTYRTNPDKVYAAAAKSDRILMQAASGGVFTALGEAFLEQGGIVYGAAMEKALIRHRRVTDVEELTALSGSKYAQSRTEEIWPQVEEDLRAGRKVLFSGTPCQCAGLRNYLGEKKTPVQELFLADIFCHGVPSGKLFRDYLAYLEEKYHGTITDYRFRDKSRGFTYYPEFLLKTEQKEKRVKLSVMEEGYWYLFQHALANRESCYGCPYASTERCGDISLGDYWGIEQAHPELLAGNLMRREKGISALLVNNEQGYRLAEQYGSGLRMYRSDLEKVTERGDALKHPNEKPEEREQILQLLREGYAGAARYVRKAMGSGYYKGIVKDRIKNVIRRSGRT